MRRVLLTLGAALQLSAAASAQTASAGSQPQPLEVRLRAVISSPGAQDGAGCAAGIFRRGRALAIATSGAADVEAARPITPDTQFYAASVSKQFTALAVMQLVARGRIGLDDDIRRFVPELPDYGRPITVRMLVHHMGGIVDDLNVAVLEGKLNASETTRADALAILFRQRMTRFPPGTRFEYSNGGYLLLSEIVERVSGEPFETYVARHVLRPLGMSRSFVMRGARSTDPDLAHGYRTVEGGVALADRYGTFGGAGGLVTTLNDFAKWDRDIDQGRVVWTRAVTRLMLEIGLLPSGAPATRRGHSLSYAGGLARGPHWLNHTGSVSGFSNIYARHPESRTGIVLLCNDGTIDATRRADAIAALLDAGLPPIGEIAPNPHPLDGDHRSPSIAATWTVETAGDTLKLTIVPPGPASEPARLTLTRTPEGEYRFTGLVLSPDDDNDGFTVTFGLVSYHFRRSVSGAGG